MVLIGFIFQVYIKYPFPYFSGFVQYKTLFIPPPGQFKNKVTNFYGFQHKLRLRLNFR